MTLKVTDNVCYCTVYGVLTVYLSVLNDSNDRCETKHFRLVY